MVGLFHVCLNGLHFFEVFQVSESLDAYGLQGKFFFVGVLHGSYEFFGLEVVGGSLRVH